MTVDVVEELGADAYIYGSTKARQHADFDEAARDVPEKPFIARVDGRKPPAKGETVYLAPKSGHVHLFDAELRPAPRRLTAAPTVYAAWPAPVAGAGHAPFPARTDDPARDAVWEHETVALQITAARPDPALLDLPWELPLETWPEEHLAALPRGISRHVVRFVKLSGRVLAVKEIKADIAGPRVPACCAMLDRLDLPCVEPFGVVSGRVDRGRRRRSTPA